MRRLEDMDGFASPEMVVVLDSAMGPTARVALVDPEPMLATEWDLIVPIDTDPNTDPAAWAVWCDAQATVWTEQLASSDIVAVLPQEVTDFIIDFVDAPDAESDSALIAPPNGCRRGLVRTLPGDELWVERSGRVGNLQALGEDAWSSGPTTVAMAAPELLEDLQGASASGWESLIDLSRSAREAHWNLVGGDVFRAAASQFIGSLDPTALRAVNVPDVLEGLKVISEARPLGIATGREQEADEISFARQVTSVVRPQAPITVVFLRTTHQRPRIMAFAETDRTDGRHHAVTHLVGGSL